MKFNSASSKQDAFVDAISSKIRNKPICKSWAGSWKSLLVGRWKSESSTLIALIQTIVLK